MYAARIRGGGWPFAGAGGLASTKLSLLRTTACISTERSGQTSILRMLFNLFRKASSLPKAGSAQPKGLVQTGLLQQGTGAVGQTSLIGAAVLHLGASALLFAPWPSESGGIEVYPVTLIVERADQSSARQDDQIAALVQSLEALPGGAEVSEDLLVTEPAPPLEVPPPKPLRRIQLPEVVAVPDPNLSPQAQIAAEKGYLAQVARRLNAAKRYPAALAGRRIGGTATIGFVITAGGQVEASWLVTSSGNTALDREALGLLQRAGPFGALPEQLGKSQLTVTQSLSFSPP